MRENQNTKISKMNFIANKEESGLFLFLNSYNNVIDFNISIIINIF
jgi:hypothetical protein